MKRVLQLVTPLPARGRLPTPPGARAKAPPTLHSALRPSGPAAPGPSQSPPSTPSGTANASGRAGVPQSTQAAAGGRRIETPTAWSTRHQPDKQQSQQEEGPTHQPRRACPTLPQSQQRGSCTATGLLHQVPGGQNHDQDTASRGARAGRGYGSGKCRTSHRCIAFCKAHRAKSFRSRFHSCPSVQASANATTLTFHVFLVTSLSAQTSFKRRRTRC